MTNQIDFQKQINLIYEKWNLEPDTPFDEFLKNIQPKNALLLRISRNHNLITSEGLNYWLKSDYKNSFEEFCADLENVKSKNDNLDFLTDIIEIIKEVVNLFKNKPEENTKEYDRYLDSIFELEEKYNDLFFSEPNTEEKFIDGLWKTWLSYNN